MKKPTFKTFAAIYGAVFVLAHIVVVWSLTRRGVSGSAVPLAMTAVNVVFITINVIGIPFAAMGFAPWRDDDEWTDIPRTPKHDWLAKSYPTNPFPVAFGCTLLFAGLFAIAAYWSFR